MTAEDKKIIDRKVRNMRISDYYKDGKSFVKLRENVSQQRYRHSSIEVLSKKSRENSFNDRQ